MYHNGLACRFVDRVGEAASEAPPPVTTADTMKSMFDILKKEEIVVRVDLATKIPVCDLSAVLFLYAMMCLRAAGHHHGHAS